MQHPTAYVESKLNGWPDRALTITLLVLAGIMIFVALRGSRVSKALAITWAVLP